MIDRVRGRLRCLSLLAVIACGGGCGSSVLGESELQVTGFGWYRLAALLLTPATGCIAQSSVTSYSLNGVTIPLGGPCGASSSEGLEDGEFTIVVRNGDERGQVVVADMFPGLQATVRDPPGGIVAPGGDITVAVPAAAQTAFPYRAWFEYTDAADPAYKGYNIFLGAQPGEEAHVPAPTHAGHFVLSLEMTPNGAFPPGRIVSCSGVARCSARAAVDLGPLAIEVTPQ